MLTGFYVIAGLVAVGCVLIFVISAMTPRPETIGLVDGNLAPLPDKPNCVSTAATDELHSIAPLTFSGNATDAVDRLAAVIVAMPSATVIEQRENYLYVEFRSRLFRYVDDVEFLIDTDTETIQFRSASRVGYSDMGVNRARMEQIRGMMQQ